MRFLSEKKALERLSAIKADFRSKISKNYEHRAKSCLVCEVKGSCCLDAHFVNVHISRLESAAIIQALGALSERLRNRVYSRIDASIDEYGLSDHGDTYAQKFACPLFEVGTGCLVHKTGKPVPCITHACYENVEDLPPNELQVEQEKLIDDLNERTYGRSTPWLPLPLAIRRIP